MSSDAPGDIALTVAPAMKRDGESDNTDNKKKDDHSKKDSRNAQPPGGLLADEPAYDDIAYALAHASELEHKPLNKDGAAFSSSSADLKVDSDGRAGTSSKPSSPAADSGENKASGGGDKPPGIDRGKSIMAPSFIRAVSVMKPGFDQTAMLRLQGQVVKISAFCLFVNAMVIILGFAVVKRKIGPFAVSNIFTLVRYPVACCAALRSSLFAPRKGDMF